MTTDSKAAQGDWAEQVARTAMGRHAVDVVALDEVASQLRAAEHRGYTMGHKAGDDFRSAALASTAGAGAGDWQPIETAPSSGCQVIIFGGAWPKPEVVSADGEWWRLRKREGSPGVPTHWMPMPAAPNQSPAVPASPRTGAGKGEEADDHAEELRQPQPVKVVARLLRKHDGTARVRARHYDMARQILSALAQGGGAGRSEKGEGEDEGRRAIRFAMGLEDHWDRFEFLNAFIGGDLSEWPEFTKPEPAPAQSPSTSDAEG